MTGTSEFRFSRWEDARARLSTNADVAPALADTETSREVARVVIGVRRALALTQSEMARRAGVSQSYIARLESGSANPSLQSLNRVLRPLGYTLNFNAAEKSGHAPKRAVATSEPVHGN